MKCIRFVECGGQGPRVADVYSDNSVRVMAESKCKWKVVSSWSQLSAFARQYWNDQIQGVVVSAAGVIEDHKKIVVCPNAHMLDKLNPNSLGFGVPVLTLNDMEAPCEGADHYFPQLLDRLKLVLTISTGIGGRLTRGGEILFNSEVGHITADTSPFAPLCGCGQRGCIEAIASGTALTKFAVGEMYAQEADWSMCHPCKWLRDCYSHGKSWAARHYDEVVIPALAQFFVNIHNAHDVGTVIIKGTLGIRSFREIPWFEDKIKNRMKMMTMNPNWVVNRFDFYLMPGPPDHDCFIGGLRLARKHLNIDV